jgi:2,6-dihydroxypyridine 3-monooxygenase
VPAMPRVIVMGGSLGGLTAALVLRDAGCDVRVFERSSSALQARGAGIAALDATLRYLVERGGYRPADVCSSTGWIRFFNRDGVSSAARARLIPGAAPSYAGYVAWRGTLPERALSPATRKAFEDAINYQVLARSHILVYPIPALDGSLAEGDRLINMVWYVNVAAGRELDQLMTGRDGVRRAVSLPPGAATGQAVAGLRRTAEQVLAAPIAEVVASVAEPFVQAVYDIDVPRMARGRVCLVGDAAFAVRPHAAAGTAKAAADGWALAEELAAAAGDVPAALAAWERRQLLLGRQLLARTREIGDASQFTGTFRPGDPRLIFGLHEPGH